MMRHPQERLRRAISCAVSVRPGRLSWDPLLRAPRARGSCKRFSRVLAEGKFKSSTNFCLRPKFNGVVSRGCSEVIPHEWPKSVPLICHLLVGQKKVLVCGSKGVWMQFSEAPTNLAWGLQAFLQLGTHKVLVVERACMALYASQTAACSACSLCFLWNLWWLLAALHHPIFYTIFLLLCFSVWGKTRIQKGVAFLPSLPIGTHNYQ